ncbi:MAG TPA: tetratricopeptide repeat protein [Alphaproteobacteria bacterium]
MSDIFTEVDEDLRRERALKLWKQYGNYVIAGAVVVVAATAGYVAWEDYSRKQAETAAAQYVAALDEAKTGKAADATKALESIARAGGAGYSLLARLEEAGMKVAAGDMAGAVAIYRQVAADSGIDREIRDAAALLAALDSVDTAAAEDLDKEVASLAASTSPWRYLAWEVQALAAAKAGKMDDARKLYSRISDDPEAPAGVRARAAEMLAALAG